MEKEYLTILSKNILSKVKENIKKNNIVFEKEQELITDQKMLEIIKSIFNNENESIYKNKKDIELNSHIMISLMQYYVAIYNDNLELLHLLLNNNFNWECTKYYDINLFILDKRITKNFESDEYIKILKNNIETFKYFYKSLYQSKDNPKINQEEIIKKFCNIIKNIENKSKIENTTHNRETQYLNITTLSNFTEQEILNFTETQKDMLGHANYFDKDFIINLIKNYNYSKNLIYWERFQVYFTIEEILNLTDEDIKQYNRIFGNCYYDNSEYLEQNAITIIKQIKKESPNFNHVLDPIVYDVLTPEQIISLSEEGSNLIKNICRGYIVHNADKYTEEIPERILRFWIKKAYNKDKIKNNIKKLIKRK